MPGSRHDNRGEGERGTVKMKTLQAKLLIGLVPTLAILVALGLWAVIMFYRLGNNIDVILRENFRSVLAAEGMKEAIERMDSGLLFEVIERMDRPCVPVTGGRSGAEQFNKNRPLFEKNLEIELGNITVAGEQELRRRAGAALRRVPGLGRSLLRPARGTAVATGRGLRPRAGADLQRDPEERGPGAAPESGEHEGDGPACPGERRDVDPADDRAR